MFWVNIIVVQQIVYLNMNILSSGLSAYSSRRNQRHRRKV